jgi:O-acetyl-ADP-ribose deacetylase (regulator of RNase III)/uncharacterized protein YwgA
MTTNVHPRIGDLFESHVQTLVNTVNTVGVMGKGIALEFKKRYPEMYKDYVRRCDHGEVQLGRPYVYTSLWHQWIVNFPTKDHWRSSAKLDDIIAGLRYLQMHYKQWGINSLAVPPLGCGEGGLEWRVVGPTLYRHLAEHDIPVELYAPFGTPPDQLEPSFLAGQGDAAADARGVLKVSPASIALVEILARIDAEPYHWPTGRISFQKVAYFATQAGIPTGLHYARGSFGPFAADLKRVRTKLENNGLLTERRSGRMFIVSAGPTFPDARRVYASYLEKWEQAIERVVDLLLRFDTSKAEVAATVHFAATELEARLLRRPTELEVLSEVMHWKRRRDPPLTREQVATAIRHLHALGWIQLDPSAALPLPESEPTVLA